MVIAKNLPKGFPYDTILGKYAGKLGDGTEDAEGNFLPPAWMNPMYTVQIHPKLNVYIDGSYLPNGEFHMGVFCNDAANEEGNCLQFIPVMKNGLGGRIPLDAPKPLHWKAKDFEPYLQVKFKRSWFESNSDSVHMGFPLCIGYGKEYWMQASNFNSLPNNEIKAEFSFHYGIDPNSDLV